VSDTTAPPADNSLRTRAISAAVLVVAAIAALYIGQWAFWLLVAVAAIAMILEWARFFRVERWREICAIGLMLVVMGFAQPLMRSIDLQSIIVLLLAAAALSLIGVRLGIGLLYIGLACLGVIYLREQGGLILALWVFVTVWATDCGAYFAGRAIGGPKLAPRFSPNKTWAGLAGGMVCAGLAAAAFFVWAGLPLWIIPLSAGLAVLAQLGDLLESWLKRRAGVKDSSNLIPGHGGVLDRLDGLLPVAICTATLLALGHL
jgi:phosphatidate cytidylyltransferase